MPLVSAKIIVKRGQSMRPLVKQARTNRLYVPGWRMSGLYRILDQYPNTIMGNDRVAMAYIDDQPVGCAVYEVGPNSAMLFVKPAYRRLGIGSKLLKALSLPKKFNYGFGIGASVKFWAKHTTYGPTL